MSLQLTPAQRRNNNYLVEIDKLSDKVDQSELNVTNTLNEFTNSTSSTLSNVTRLPNVIKNNEDVQDVPFSYLNSDVVAYYDFASTKYLGRDQSGRNNHLNNELGVVQSKNFEGMKYSARMVAEGHTANDSQGYETQRVMYSDTMANDLKLASYSFAFWYNEESVRGFATLFSLSDKNETTWSQGPGGTYLEVRTFQTTNDISIIYVHKGNIIMTMNVAATPGDWHHVAFTMSPTGNAFYVDGVKATVYAAGSASTYINLSNTGVSVSGNMNCNILSLGGNMCPVGNPNAGTRPMFGWQYNGYLSDVIIYNRALHLDEVTRLFNNDIGNAVVILAGQSNMVGWISPVAGIDDDYTLHNNRVNTYQTWGNVNLGTFAITASNIVQATNPMPFPDNRNPNCGPWRTFCNDVIQYSDIPHRMKVLLIPVARGGSAMASWVPTTLNYRTTVAAVNDIMTATKPANRLNKIVAFLWNQGEAEMLNNTNGLNYVDQFNSMMTGFQNEITGFNKSTVPTILTTISGQYDGNKYTGVTPNVLMKPFINAALNSIVATNPNNYGIVKTMDFTYAGDNEHISAPSIRVLGSRYYDEFVRLSKIKSRKPSADTALIINGTDNIVLNTPVSLTKGLTLPLVNVTGWTDVPLTSFCTKTYVFNITGAVGTPTMTCRFTKFNNIVFVNYNEFTLTIGPVESAPIISGGQLDAFIRPAYTQFIPIADGNGVSIAVTLLFLKLSPDGSIQFRDSAEEALYNLPSNGVQTIRASTFSYICV